MTDRDWEDVEPGGSEPRARDGGSAQGTVDEAESRPEMEREQEGYSGVESGIDQEDGTKQGEVDPADIFETEADTYEGEREPEGHGEGPGASGPLVDTENMSARTMQFANSLVNNVSLGESARVLSYEDFDPYSERDLETFEAYPSFEDEVFDGLQEHLEAERVLLLVGHRGIGKGGCVKTLAARLLRSSREAASALKRRGPSEALMTSLAMREVRVPLPELLAKNEKFHHRIVVLEDAFDGDNPDLVRLIESLDEALLRSVTHRLETIGSYLALTTTPERIPKGAATLERLGIVSRLETPPPSLVLRALHRRSRILFELWADTMEGRRKNEEKLEELLERDGDRIVGVLGSVPQVVRFVDGYLKQVISGELSLEEALERVDDLEHWLLKELPAQDEDVWTFVLALTLASADRSAGWVPWTPLHHLWQEVAQILDVALGRDREESSRSAQSLVMDRQFLSRARVTARRLPFPVGECVRFEEPGLPSRLWRALLGPGRRIFTLLIERLRCLAEGSEPGVRRLASQALGRAGEFDPRGLFYRQVHGWVKSADGRLQWALGGLYSGALSSEDEVYRAACLYQLRKDLRSDSSKDVLRGIHILSQMGLVDRSFAMRELRAVLAHHLETFVDDVQEINTALRRAKANFDISGRSDRWTAEALHRVYLDEWASQRLTPLQRRVLDNVRYVLVGLCFTQDPLRIFEALKGWLSCEKPGLPPLVGLVCLNANGILDILGRNQIVSRQHDDSGTPKPIGQILTALRTEQDALDLAEFLESLYLAVEPLPIWFRNRLRRNLRTILRRWAREMEAQEYLHEIGVPLFAALLSSSEATLREIVFELLEKDEAFRDEEGRLKPFARTALDAEPPRRSVV